MITANFIHRTFRIRRGSSIGTAFTIDVDQRQYVVTARHVVEGFDDKSDVGVFGNGDWTEIAMSLVGHGDGETDVSVLAPENPLSPPELPIHASSAGMTYGQEVYFLGFPYDILGSTIFTDQGYPLPFVKRATFSCFAGDAYLLDGHNNPGFSGGPVLFGSPGVPPTNVGAVISGYKFISEPIYHQSVATDLSFKYNTGIIVSYKIEKALALIGSNPIGATL